MPHNLLKHKSKMKISGFFDVKSLPAYRFPLNDQGRNVDVGNPNKLILFIFSRTAVILSTEYTSGCR
jgi:hypothetical protein